MAKLVDVTEPVGKCLETAAKYLKRLQHRLTEEGEAYDTVEELVGALPFMSWDKLGDLSELPATFEGPDDPTDWDWDDPFNLAVEVRERYYAASKAIDAWLEAHPEVTGERRKELDGITADLDDHAGQLEAIDFSELRYKDGEDE